MFMVIIVTIMGLLKSSLHNKSISYSVAGRFLGDPFLFLQIPHVYPSNYTYLSERTE